MTGMHEDQHTPLWKQLLGAATGATVALLLYGGFAVMSPNLSLLTAYLSSTFEGEIEHLPTYQRSPKTIREEVLAQREALGDRARAATARLQKGENYFQKSSPPSSSVSTSVASEVKNQQQKEEVVPEEAAKPTPPKEQDRRSEQKEEKHAGKKHKEEKLPDTGVPLWAIGSVALCLAVSLRYRKGLYAALQRSGSLRR